ncbi:mast cell protease 3-like, partial [Oryx dammah]|uniref:mast cell protease 3-like n=1 Tax=Oryx dammah TaxID=59534 RepID=UPI001A9BB83A
VLFPPGSWTISPVTPPPFCSLCSSLNVTLGAHNIMDRERTKQVIPVRRAIPHPRYNDETGANDIMLLQLTRKADMTDAVSLISLPRSLEKVKPGMMCSVAGWGQLGVNMPSADKLQEVDLELQSEEKCIARFKYYIPITQICAGDPSKRKDSFSVSSPVLSVQNPGLN